MSIRILTVLSFMFFSFHSYALSFNEEKISSEKHGWFSYSIAGTPEKYNVVTLKIKWGKFNSNNFKSATFLVNPNSPQPSDLPFLAVQDMFDNLVTVSAFDRVNLEYFLNKLDKNISTTSFVETHIVNLINARTLTQEFFDGVYKSFSKTNDGKKWSVGRYTVGAKTNYVMTPVEDIETQCFGRAGSRCGRDNSGVGIYTSRALSHDICHRVEDSQAGVCFGEFVDAGIDLI